MTSSFDHTKIFADVRKNLPKCIKSHDIQPFAESFDPKISEAVKCCIEAAVRDYTVQSLCKGNKTDLGKLKCLVTLCVEAVKRELALPTLPVLVLSDSFESLTIIQGEELFGYVEENVAIWKAENIFAPCKNYVLRMCNDLLRRLSRTQNTIFCGRILLFLARFFPFSERSGLNLISEFNLENVTTFTSMEPMDDIIEDDEKSNDKLENPAKDYTFYTKFWALQDFFRNPPQCFQKGPWKLFTTYADDVLKAFSVHKLQDETIPLENRLPKSERNNKVVKDQSDQYFAKYLTNQKLLELQFSDCAFRRYLLLQMLILFQYLTANIKFKQESLNEEQLRKLGDMEKKVFVLLAETPPDGAAFVKTVKHTLTREDKWNQWKNLGCPAIEKPSKPPAEKVDPEAEKKKPVKSQKRKRPLGDLVKDADSKKKFIMGNAEMTRLWNLNQDNLDACRTENRDFIPSLKDYFTPAVNELRTTKDKHKLLNDANFGWQGLRLLACKSPHFFVQSSPEPITKYLTATLKKMVDIFPDLTKEIEMMEEELKNNEKAEEKDGDTPSKEGDEDEGSDDKSERQDLQPLSDAEQKDLAFNLSQLGPDKWKVLAKKLGFQKDEIEFMETDKTCVEERAAFCFQLWVDNEGAEANKPTLLYILEGLGMSSIAKGVFN